MAKYTQWMLTGVLAVFMATLPISYLGDSSSGWNGDGSSVLTDKEKIDVPVENDMPVIDTSGVNVRFGVGRGRGYWGRPYGYYRPYGSYRYYRPYYYNRYYYPYRPGFYYYRW